MAIPMIEAMRQKLLAVSRSALEQTQLYKEGNFTAEKLQNMNDTLADFDLMMESLTPEEVIELIRKN